MGAVAEDIKEEIRNDEIRLDIDLDHNIEWEVETEPAPEPTIVPEDPEVYGGRYYDDPGIRRQIMSTVNANLDNKLFVECPERFHLLDDEELAAMTFLDDGSKLCMSDPDKHILISISNKRINGFSSMMLKTSDVAGNMIKQIAQGMKPYGFKQLNTVEKIVAGRKAEGLDYEYEAQGIGMSGESLVLKDGKDLYYFHFYCRKETAAAGLEKFRKILDAVSIK